MCGRCFRLAATSHPDCRHSLSRGGGIGGLASAVLVAVTALATACGDGGVQPESPQPNRAPVPQGSIAAQTVPVGETVVVSVGSAFSDPDGDALTYAAASSAPGVATVAASGANVSVTGVSAGTADVTVTASDPGGLSAQQAFQATVPNRPPEVTDTIPDQTLHVGDTVSVTLVQHFTDPDGDELTYEAISSDVGVVRASVSDSMVTIAAVGSGTANISVAASDPGGLRASQDLGVTVAERGVCGRTPQIRDGIVEAIGASGCESVTTADLAGIRTLRFNRVGLTSLRQGDFDGLAALEFLRIADNQLVSLPEAVFVGLESLRSLTLSQNGLTSISSNAFSGLTALEWLSLLDNQLVSLPDGVFADLTSLEELVLSNNQLASLQPNVFAGLRNVYNLFLSGNNLASLDEGVFVGLDSLSWLVLSHNGLTSISNNPFSGLDNLGSLNLDNNELMSLTDSVFSDLAGLQLLYLQNNRLTSLTQGVFSGLDEISSLWLSSNQLESLPERVFSGLHELEGLLLDDNLLSSLPEGVFTDMSAQQISLGANQLTSLPEGVFSGLTDLKSLDLSANQLQSLPSGISGLISLQGLFLHENQLESLPEGVFSELSSLQALVLSDNQLESLPEGIFSGLPGFEWLWLHNNPGAPFEFRLQFERIDGPNGVASPDSVRLVLAEGAPFDLSVPLTLKNGTLSVNTASLSAGSTTGPALSVTQRTTGQSTRVTATGIPPDLDSNPAFEGFVVGWPAELVLFGSGTSWNATGFRSAALTIRGGLHSPRHRWSASRPPVQPPPSPAEGDLASIRLARGWIALECLASRRMR